MCEKGENPVRMVDHDKLVQQGQSETRRFKGTSPKVRSIADRLMQKCSVCNREHHSRALRRFDIRILDLQRAHEQQAKTGCRRDRKGASNLR